MSFEIDWDSLIVGRKFTGFALFHFVFEGNFQVQAPRGAYIWRGDLTKGFCVTSLQGLYLEGLIHGGAYFRNFTVNYFKVFISSSKYFQRVKSQLFSLPLSTAQLYLRKSIS